MIPILEFKVDNLERIFNRSQLQNKEINHQVEDILDLVQTQRDKALFSFVKKFDNLEINSKNLVVSEDVIDRAYQAVSPELIQSIRRAKENILDYHDRQRKRFENNIYKKDGNELGWLYRAMGRVGLYIPGGKASYPSSVLMCALPAVSAGVSEIVVATPSLANPLMLVACRECGVKKIYNMGGAHAIAALAYGTESVEKVDLIAGPGNIYVTMAKKMVYGHVAIDMIAGPSEILIIADESANSEFVAADMLSQAEHDEMAASIVVTTSMDFALGLQKEIDRQVNVLERKEIVEKSLNSNGCIVVVKSIDEALHVSDLIAPEHLEICCNDAKEVALRVKNAGAIFVGNYSPEPLGDYFAGPSHCLPTSGSARYFSVLSVDTFMKKLSYINYSQDGLEKNKDDIIAIASSEGLTAHANTIKIRFKK